MVFSHPQNQPNPFTGGDTDMGIDPDIKTIQEGVKLLRLECLRLHIEDHTRDAENVSRVSDSNDFLLTSLCTYTEAEHARNGIVDRKSVV